MWQATIATSQALKISQFFYLLIFYISPQVLQEEIANFVVYPVCIFFSVVPYDFFWYLYSLIGQLNAKLAAD